MLNLCLFLVVLAGRRLRTIQIVAIITATEISRIDKIKRIREIRARETVRNSTVERGSTQSLIVANAVIKGVARKLILTCPIRLPGFNAFSI
jgi:hypothetical protein